MHYLNILTIRIYTLFSVLSTRLPDWLRHGMSFVAIPVQYGNKDWNQINQMSMNSLYDSKYRPVADFYISFSKYLNTTRPVYSWLSFVGGHILKWLYELLSMLLRVYASMFSIFGDVTNNGSVRYWFKMIQHVGWVAFGLLLVIYGFGMIFNLKGGFARMKDFIVGAMLAIFVVALLPSLTSGFTTGMQKVASNMLGVSEQTTMNESSKSDNNPHGEHTDIMGPADEIVRDNVISIPMMTNYQAINGHNTVDMSNNHVFQKSSSDFSDHVPIQPYSINLYHMKGKDRDIWNGIGDTNIVDFLNQIGGDGYYLNKQTVDDNSKFIDSNLGKSDFYNSNPTASNPEMLNPVVSGAFRRIFNLPNKNAENYKDYGERLYAPYMHQMAGSGTEARVSRLDQFNAHPSDAIGLFHSSYPKYHIAWFNILVGFLSLAWVLFGLLFKLTNSFFKMVVMYVTSGWFLMKNAADHDKIKDFVRTFFGIFENLIIDLVVLRLFLDVYLVLMGTLEKVPHLSPLAIAIIQPLITIGLLKVQTKGIDTLSSQMSGSNTQSGNGLGAIGAAAIGYQGLRSIGRGAKGASKATAKGGMMATAGGARGIKHLAGGWKNQKAKMNGGKPNESGSKNSRVKSATGNIPSSSNGQPGSNNNPEPEVNENGNPVSHKGPDNHMSSRAGRSLGFMGRSALVGAGNKLKRFGTNYGDYSLVNPMNWQNGHWTPGNNQKKENMRDALGMVNYHDSNGNGYSIPHSLSLKKGKGQKDNQDRFQYDNRPHTSNGLAISNKAQHPYTRHWNRRRLDNSKPSVADQSYTTPKSPNFNPQGNFGDNGNNNDDDPKANGDDLSNENVNHQDNSSHHDLSNNQNDTNNNSHPKMDLHNLKKDDDPANLDKKKGHNGRNDKK